MPTALTAWKAYYQWEYIADHSASYDTIALEDLTEKEHKTIQRIDKPIAIETANGDIVADSGADIFMHHLEMLVLAFVLPSPTPPLLSIGLMADELDVKFAWGKQRRTDIDETRWNSYSLSTRRRCSSYCRRRCSEQRLRGGPTWHCLH